MRDRRVRTFASFSGVAAVILTFAGLAAGGSTPDGAASIEKVSSFYATHSTSQNVSGVLLSLGALSFVMFAAAGIPSVTQAVPNLCVAGATIVAVGLSIYAGLSLTLADVTGKVSQSTLQALNALANGAAFVFLITVGTTLFLVGAAVDAALRATLPRWLTWLAVVCAVIGAIPSHILGGTLDHIGLFAFAGLAAWVLVASVTFVRRVWTSEASSEAPATAAG